MGGQGPARTLGLLADGGEAVGPGVPKHIGKYEIKRIIGSGGMGIVWGAWDPELDRRVAIKLVKAQLTRARERIVRDHPELVGWWASQESAIGGRFHAHEPGYAETLARVRRLPLLPMDLDAEAMRCTSGACTDRRPRPRHVDPQADAAVAALVYARTGETASEAA